MKRTSQRISFAVIVTIAIASPVSSAQVSAQLDTSQWKSYRNEQMGFEAKYPDNWHVRSVTVNRPGIESAMVDETPRVGKPHLAVQFWVQRRANPDGLPIEQWYASQLRKMKASPPLTLITAIGGRTTVRMEANGTLGRTFQFFTSLNKTDIFEITMIQPSSQTELDSIYQTLLSTIRFIN
jgi:hypothetical protein